MRHVGCAAITPSIRPLRLTREPTGRRRFLQGRGAPEAPGRPQDTPRKPERTHPARSRSRCGTSTRHPPTVYCRDSIRHLSGSGIVSSDQAGAPSATSPVEIFSIGKELLIGQIQDSNSFWLSQQITSLGGAMQRITILDDDQPSIVKAFRDAIDRGAKTIVTTGGLGPTID